MWPFKQCCFQLFASIFWTTNALSIWRKVVHQRATLYSCFYNCDDLLSHNSSPHSSHVWFSYIHNFRATLSEPKHGKKLVLLKRLAQLGRFMMIHVGPPPKHSQLFPIFSLHNSPLWPTHPGQLGQGKTNRAWVLLAQVKKSTLIQLGGWPFYPWQVFLIQHINRVFIDEISMQCALLILKLTF